MERYPLPCPARARRRRLRWYTLRPWVVEDVLVPLIVGGLLVLWFAGALP